jgi:signal transduction histidine kinase
LPTFTKAYTALVWLVFLFSGGYQTAYAQSATLTEETIHTAIEYCNTSDTTHTLEQAIDCTYQPQKKLNDWKLTGSTLWIRLNISSSKPQAQLLAIHVAPHFLNDITLYEQTDQVWQRQQAGSGFAFDPERAQLGGYTFKVRHQGAGTQTFYLRVASTGIPFVLVHATPWDLLGLTGINQQLGLGIQLGALLLILSFSLISYVLNRNILMGRFSILMLNLLLCTLAGSGLLAKYIFEQTPTLDDMFFNWMLCLRLACWIWVGQAFLLPYQVPRWYGISCRFFYFLVFISLALVSMSQQALSHLLMAIGITLFSLVQILAIIRTPDIERFYRTILLAGFLCADALIVLTILLAMYPLASETSAVYVARFVDFVNPLVLLSIMTLRNRITLAEFSAVKTTLFQTSLRSEFERKLLHERRVLIDMLTHELKNPLASISLAIGSLSNYFQGGNDNETRRLQNIEQSIRNMDAVIERCSLMNQLDQKELPPCIESTQVTTLIQDLMTHQANSDRFRMSLLRDVNIKTDAYFLKIVLTNLFENAVKYSPANSIIDIALFEKDQEGEPKICITVSNVTGARGHPDPALLYQRFYRNPLALNVVGSGLGLYLVKELCRIIGAQITYLPARTSVNFLVELPKT